MGPGYIDFEKKESGIDKKAKKIKQKILNYKSDSKLPFGDAKGVGKNIEKIENYHLKIMLIDSNIIIYSHEGRIQIPSESY